ncbi:MAG: hypothetical protein PHE50_07200 [Dehalococcoidales bacterium]|nr:hypothetical protein [Dehalococcoidales bacterium]
MTTRIERILNSIKINAGDDVYERVVKTSGVSDVKTILDILEEVSGAETVSRVMRPCGYQCISAATILRAKAIHNKSTDLPEFLRLLNDQRIGGGKLHIRDGNIIGIYEKCYCGIAKETGGLAPLYCHCSAGWYEHVFTSVFEKPVEVKKICTILGGADRCEFEIIASKT